MEFEPSPRTQELLGQLAEFIDAWSIRPKPVYAEQVRASGDPHFHPQVMEELKAEAARGLWNLFLPDDRATAPASPTSSTHRCASSWGSRRCRPGGDELLGARHREHGAARAVRLAAAARAVPRSRCSTAGPLVLRDDRAVGRELRRHQHPEPDRPRRRPLRGERAQVVHDRRGVTAVHVHHPHGRVGSRTPTATAGTAWCSSRSTRPACTVERSLPVFDHDAGGGHCETLFDDVRVPAEHLLGEEGAGFALAQARLGPGRIHHCMRAIGMAEKALRLMCERTQQRVAFGRPLADQGTIQAQVAESRIEIEQARLLTLKAAWLIDTVGTKGARFEISAIKVVAARLATTVIDRAIQTFGAAGVTNDWPLAEMWGHARTLHLVDGPDEVHLQQIARRELRPYEGFRTRRRPWSGRPRHPGTSRTSSNRPRRRTLWIEIPSGSTRSRSRRSRPSRARVAGMPAGQTAAPSSRRLTTLPRRTSSVATTRASIGASATQRAPRQSTSYSSRNGVGAATRSVGGLRRAHTGPGRRPGGAPSR